LHRKVTVVFDELGHEERIEPVNDLRLEIRNWSTAAAGCSVRESSTSWRMVDRIAATQVQPRGILESDIEWIPRPRQWLFFFLTTKPGKMRAF
jgi:hypothetical protein